MESREPSVIRSFVVWMITLLGIVLLPTPATAAPLAYAMPALPAFSAPVETVDYAVPAVPAQPAPEAPAAPAATNCTTVTSGDTLGELATANGVTLDRVLELNPRYRDNPGSVYPGNEVCFDGSAPEGSTTRIELTAHEIDTPAAPETEAPAPAETNSSAAQLAIAFAMTQLGKPYKWGAEGPGSYDCSGIVQAAYAHAGISIPRTSNAQSRFGRPVSRADLQPGDLVFFYSPVSHVSLYIGDGNLIDAPKSGDVVRIRSLEGRDDSYHSARRI